MKIKGKVGRSDLEGGYLTLEGADGKTYKLEGATAQLAAGQQVEIDGAVEEAGFGIGFGAPVLKVKSHRAA